MHLNARKLSYTNLTDLETYTKSFYSETAYEMLSQSE